MGAHSRLTIGVHVLTWMELARRGRRDRMTSEQIAASVNTNPVVVRRCLGDLLRAGLVEVRHGAGAGWTLARPAGEITLGAVYAAVEPDPLFALHRTEPNQACPVGRGIRPALDEVYGEAAHALRDHLDRTSIADVLHRTLATRAG